MKISEKKELFTRIDTDSGAVVTVFDELKPEESAMVQSMNSRSAGGFWKNLQKVEEEGTEEFMKKFYSGYGHKSIADCGSTSAACDGISMLAAKAIQDWWAYNGQETSTRYIDTTGLGYLNPVGTENGEQLMKRLLKFYLEAIEPTIAYLKIIRPKKDSEDEKKYNTMIEKRAYDVLGSFLPAGAKTNASCHMELRQWDEKIQHLRNHPLYEVTQIGETLYRAMAERYPSTFIRSEPKNDVEKEKRRARNQYRKEIEPLIAYQKQDKKWANVEKVTNDGFLFNENFFHDMILSYDYKSILANRPKGVEVPKIINECGNFRIEFLIDFRSHRDLQRQRSALQRVPLLTTEYGFEKWYLNHLPENLRTKAELLLKEHEEIITNLPCDDFTKQYYIPMGYRVYDVFTISLADLIYIIELRTQTTVHPTARVVAIEMYKCLRNKLPEFVKIYANTSTDDFDIRRADQDLFIGEKRLSEK